MSKLISILLLFTGLIYSQENTFLHWCGYDYFLDFLPDNENLIILNYEEYFSKTKDTSFLKYAAIILSKNDGSVLKEIRFTENEGRIYDIALANDGKSFAILTGNRKDIFRLKKYSLKEDSWVWNKEWQDNGVGLRISYSPGNEHLICVTSQKTIIFDSESGSNIKSSDSISSIINYHQEFSKFNISKNGKYFAIWRNKYFTYSKYDEAGLEKLVDLLWYGIKWIFHLGSIPQYIYVWDIYEDKLYDKIAIPYNTKQGMPAFTENEANILIGPMKNGMYQEYSLKDRKIIREYFQADSIQDQQLHNNPARDFKKISPDNKYFVNCINDDDIFVIDFNSGSLLMKQEQSSRTISLQRHAVSFSSDGNYFAVVARKKKISDAKTMEEIETAIKSRDQIMLFKTGTWDKLWGVDLCTQLNNKSQ